MAHIIKEEKAEVMRDIAVYVIVSPFDENAFYISKTGSDRLRKTYTEHYGLRIAKTKTLFAKAKELNLLPAIYVLESTRMSDREAFRRCVAWTKYFLEKGFSQISPDILTEYANDLTDATGEFYDKIKDEPLEEVLQPDGGILPNYGKRSPPKTKDSSTVISIHLSDSEYAQIKERAEKQGLSLGAYCLKMSLNGRVVQNDFSMIGKYLEEFTKSKTLLRQILFTIYKTGNYYPADLKNIQKYIDNLTEIQKKVNDEITRAMQTLRE